MRLLNIKLFILTFLLFPFKDMFSQNALIPSVKIKDHKANTEIINIDCDYDFLPNKGIRLTAEYPEIRQTNSYSASSIRYVPIGDFTQGEIVDIRILNGKEDDIFSKAINLPFSFCFYGNLYSQIVISDNGVVSFNMASAQKDCAWAPQTPLPNGLPENSIFGVFHDMQNINRIQYWEEGSYPNRRVIINYNSIQQWSYEMSGKKNSTSQIVLYETTNIIDVYVKDRFKNESTNSAFDGIGAYRKNAVIGLTNYDSSGGIAAPGRDTGNWEAHNEAWRFTPSGSTDITIRWSNEYNSEILGTRNLESILVYPSQNTKYKVNVTYNICTPILITDVVEVKFSQDFPTAKEITTAAFCINNGGSYTLDLTQYEPEINPDSSLAFSYFEDQNLTIPITNPKNAYVFSNNKTIYVKVLKSGICFSIGKLNLRLNKKPVINPNQLFEKCNEGNDGKETVNLSSLGILGLSGMGYKYFASLDNAIDGIPAITNYTNYPLDITGELDNTKTLYLRVWNNSYNDPDCYTIVPFKIKLKKYVKVKKPSDPFLICYVTDGQLIKNYNLTQYEPLLLDAPSTGINFAYYTNSNYAASYKIPNPVSATFTINTTVYIKATATGYCDAYTQISLAADDNCDGTPGSSGSGGGSGSTGSGGPGGEGGSICDTDETAITVNLDVDYLKFYLYGGLTLSNITITGFYDSANNSLLSDTAPYSYTFSPPFFKVIQAQYKIKATGLESYVNFPVSASKKAEMNPNSFDVCDTYNDGKESVTLKANSNPKPKWQVALETKYPGATIHFFATSGDLNNYESDPADLIYNDKIITNITLANPLTTVYIYVKFYGCIYTHEINFNLVPVVEKSINPPYVVCDFNDDKKELINIIGITNNETDVKNKLTLAQLTGLQTPIRYYRTLTQAHAGANNYITNLTNFEINTLQMSLFARLNVNNECPVIVEVKFQFTTSVALPVLKNLIICDINNDNQELADLNEAIVSSDPNAKITFYGTLASAKQGDEASLFFIPFALAANYLVTVSPSTIYVRVYDTVTTCFKVLPFTVTLVRTPILSNTIIKSCDFENDGKEILTAAYMQAQLITNNQGILYTSPRMTYKFYETQSAALINTGTSLNSFEATTTNSVWVNIAQSIGDCPIVVEIKFNLISAPALEVKPLIYTICNNNTGNENGATKENVILDRYKNDILGFPATNNYTFSYYATAKDDAVSGGSFGKVSSAYTITSFPKTIWIRVTYTPTGCFSIKPIVFQQTSSLESVITDSEIITCAGGEMSKIIDLKDYPAQMITASANLNDFNVSYHISRANAVSNSSITSDLTRYTVTPTSQIWIKFVSKATGCYIIKKLSVTIYSTPKAQDISSEICDETDGKLDGNYVISDLHAYKYRIITGEPNLDNLYVFTYYKNQIDAAAGNGNTVSNLNYTFTEADVRPGLYPDSNLYTIYARIDKLDNTGCFSVVGISFQINKKVSVNSIQPEILICDESDNDGKTNFDLSSVKDEISITSGVGIKYYPTKEDAQKNTNEIIAFTRWQNRTPYEHVVYVRIKASGYCDNIASIKLKVYPYIQVNDYTSTVCEFKSDGKTKSTVDLLEEVKNMTSKINNITGYPGLLNDIDIRFYSNLSDAQNPILANSIPAANLSSYMIPVGITRIWVRFQSKITKCFEIKQLTITKLKAPEIKVELTPFRCSAENELLDALVTLVTSNEDESYRYSFDNGITFSDTKNTFTVNSTRTINYVVVDKNGCSVTGNVFVSGYNPPTSMNITATPIYCNTPGGFATVTVTSVTGPAVGTSYTYEIINPVGIAPSNTTGIFSGLLPEKYQIKATDDASKCYAIKSIEITKAPQISTDVKSHIDVLCYGESTGSITYAINNFIASTNYSCKLIPNVSGLAPSQVGDVITYSDLPAGKYTFTVTDNISGCAAEKIFTINQPSKLKLDAALSPITCTGANDAKIVITASGGTGVIKYAISPNLTLFNDEFVFDHLPPGIYKVLIQDESGCSGDGPLTLEIIEPSVLSAKVLEPVLQEICAGDKDGTFSVAFFGGTPPYSISLNNKNGSYTTVSDTQYDFTKLADGNYKVFIKDSRGCLTEVEVMMNNAVILNPKTEINYDCVSNAATNAVIITVHESNANPDEIDYALDDSTTYQPSNVFANVAPGKHTVTARHTNGCEQTTLPFIIDEIKTLTLTLTNDGLNEIVAAATGGYGEYRYGFEEESHSLVNKFIIYKSGIYTVTVTDKKGCTAIASKYFEYIDVCIPDHFTPNGDGINDEWGPGCTVNYKDLTYTVFDRHGRIICRYKLGQKWDGKYDGTELPTGDYWYVLKLNDPKDNREFIGHFTLYR